jgi:hypothetical protein
MSANDTIRTVFKTLLGDTFATQDHIDAFFKSEMWEQYPDHTDFDSLLHEVGRQCVAILQQRMANPAVFIAD